MKPRVGMVVTGISTDLSPHLVACRRFDASEEPPHPEALMHGGQLARVILQHCPQAELLVASIDCRTRPATAEQVIDALEWLTDGGAHLINMSFGIPRAPLSLQAACRRIWERGVLLLAPVSTRGPVSYPAAFLDCLAIASDPRCSASELSWLNHGQADFGASPLPLPGSPDARGGVSIACARVSGMATALLAQSCPPSTVPRLLRERARYNGPLRQSA